MRFPSVAYRNGGYRYGWFTPDGQFYAAGPPADTPERAERLFRIRYVKSNGFAVKRLDSAAPLRACCGVHGMLSTFFCSNWSKGGVVMGRYYIPLCRRHRTLEYVIDHPELFPSRQLLLGEGVHVR